MHWPQSCLTNKKRSDYSFIRSQVTEGSVVIRYVYCSTRRGLSNKEKYEVTNFSRSKITQCSQNVKNRSRDPMGVIPQLLYSTFSGLSIKEKNEVSSFTGSIKSFTWVLNLTSRSRDLTTPIRGVIHHPFYSTRRGLSTKKRSV